MKGQIVKIISNLYTVNCDGTFYDCHNRGKFRNDKITPLLNLLGMLEKPTDGEIIIDEKNKYILEVEPRKNRLIRPVVSNIDQGLIITSVKIPDFSTNLLDKFEVKEIECLGLEFDPHVAEAVLTDHDETKPENVVLEVLTKGYKYKDKVIRHAMVKVNK